MRMRILVPALVLAACGGGGDGAVVEATFAPGVSADGVWVVESERRERADSSGFRLAELTPGPMSIRLLSGGDTAALLDVSGLPPDATLRLRELRVDAESRLAFPRAVELDGAQIVTINGMRMAPEERIPRKVDIRGAVLAWSSDVGALLVRPADARLPDLRVVVGTATEVVGTDGGGADPVGMNPGDSIRVEGRRQESYVLASRLTLPTRIGGAPPVTDADPAAAEGGGKGNESEEDEDGGGATDRTAGTPSGATAAQRGAAPVVRVEDRQGRGRGRGAEKGKGQAKGRN